MPLHEEQANSLFTNFKFEVKQIFEQLEIATFDFTSYDHYTNNAKVELRVSNNVLKNLGFKNRHKKIIHYTSIESLYSIIHSGVLRLYDLNNANDPSEYQTFFKSIGFQKPLEFISSAKKQIFTASFCGFNEDQSDSAEMWRLYGNDGRGVALVFDILNPEDDWYKIILGSVLYDANSELKGKLLELIRLIEKYHSLGFDFSSYPILINLLCSFFKSEFWRIENEVRMILPLKYDEHDLSIKDFSPPVFIDNVYPIINKSGIKTSYIEFPLSHIVEKRVSQLDNKADILKKIPLLKLTSIIMGYQIKPVEFDDYASHLMSIIRKRLGTYVPINRSRFSIYWDEL